MSRNRHRLTAILSAPVIDGPHDDLLAIADRLEQEEYFLAGHRQDGPTVELRFEGPQGTLAATLSELRSVARSMRAGHPDAWRALLLPESLS
jgi:hypothetical protein